MSTGPVTAASIAAAAAGDAATVCQGTDSCSASKGNWIAVVTADSDGESVGYAWGTCQSSFSTSFCGS